MLTLSEEALLGEPTPPAAIIVTVPSSPDDSPTRYSKTLRTPPLQALESRAPSDSTTQDTFDQSLLSPSPTMSQTASVSLFQQRLAESDLPPPGADHFAARRALWWTPGPNSPSPTEANSSRRRLEALLAHPDALEDDAVWEAGVDRVWRGLIGGAKLKHRLPLPLIVSLHLHDHWGSMCVFSAAFIGIDQDPESWMDTRRHMAERRSRARFRRYH